MKNSFASFKDFYKKYSTPVKAIYRKRGIRPGTDWKVIVCMFGIFLLCIGGVSAFIYMGVKNNTWWMVDDTNTVYQVKINQKNLEEVIDRFQSQKEKLQSLKSTGVFLNDPSL